MSDAKRMEIRERIEAGEARQAARLAAERAGQATDRLTTIAREHPLLLIAGGLAIGAALSTLIPRSPTRKLSKNAIAMLATVAELGIAYGKQAMEAAEDAGQAGREKAGEWGQAIADGASKLRDRVKETVED